MLVKPSVIIPIVISVMVFSGVEAADLPATSASQPPAVTATAPAANPEAEPSRTVTFKPSVTRTLDTQLSGFTSQDAEQLFARLALQETRKKQNWFVRGSLAKTKTINGKSTASVLTSRLDSRLEHMTSPNSYTVLTGVLSRRDRNYSKRKDQESGYQFMSYGVGKPLGPKAKGDIGLGFIEIFEESRGISPSAMVSLRGSRPLGKTLTLESDLLVLQPLTRIRDTKIDSEIGLAHALSPGLSLRLTWSLNNLVRSINTNREWDSGIRVSISYRHTSTK